MYLQKLVPLSLCICLSFGLYGQSEDISVYGFLDGVLPIGIHHNGQEECLGHLSIRDKKIQLEGECTDSSFVLYEFDNSARVIASLSGELVDETYELEWHSHDHKMNFKIHASGPEKHKDIIKVYTAKDGEAYDQVFIRPDTREIFMPILEDKKLRWLSYACPTANYACQVTYGDKQMTLSLSDRVVSIGSQLYHWKEDISIDYAVDEGYHFYHSFGLLVIGLLANNASKWLSYAGWSFVIGILFFSGSLYLLACRSLLEIPEGLVKVLGPMTPIGGVFFIVGWVLLFVGVRR